MSETTSTKRALLWSFLEQGGAKAVTLLVQVVLARLLAPEAFGTLAIMMVVVEVANVISQSGLGTALIQKQELSDADCDTALWTSLAIAAALYVLTFMTAPVVGAFYEMPDLAGYLRVLALGVPLNAANSVQRSVLQREMDFKAIFRANVAAALLSGVVGVGLALAGVGVWALVAQSVVLALVACAVMYFAVPWRPRMRVELDAARELVSYGWKVCATGILNVVYTGGSELVLGKACSAAELGLYSQGRKWPNAGIGVATNAIQNVMFPAFAKLQDDAVALASAVRRSIATGTWAIAGVAMLGFAIAQTFVGLVLGEQWLGCVTVFRLACAGACLTMVQVVNLRAYMALGDSGLYLRLQVVKVVVLCAAIWPVAALTHSITAAAWANFLAGVANTIFVDMRPARRMHGVAVAEQLKLVCPTIGCACVAAGVACIFGLTPLPGVVMLLAQTVTYIACYLVLSAYLRMPGADDGISLARKAISRR